MWQFAPPTLLIFACNAEIMILYFEILDFQGSAILAINHILAQKGLNVEFELGVIIN